MFTNRKRNRAAADFLLSALRRRVQHYASPYHLSEKEQSVSLTTALILRHRRALQEYHAILQERRHRSAILRYRRRAPRRNAAELTRHCARRRPFLSHLLLALLHPTSLFRRPRFLWRNKKRRTFRLRRTKPTQPA